jgi:hypothetical protein
MIAHRTGAVPVTVPSGYKSHYFAGCAIIACMNASLRACIANIAAQLAGQNTSGTVYDHTQNKHVSVSGSVTGTSVNLYDHDRGCHVSGSPSNLYDHGEGNHLSLTMQGMRFDGYDHGSAWHYSGDISGSSVTIYDHETAEHHHYSV